MGKKRSSRLNACILTEANSVDDVELEGDVAHAESPKELRAWGLDSTQQVRDEKTGRSIQVISERSFKPITIFSGGGESAQVVGKNVTTISSQTEDEELVFLEEKKSKDGRLLWVGICLALLTLTVCLVVLFKMQGA